MNILMVTSSFPRFDGDYFGPWVIEYCIELVKQGNTVTIVAPQSEKSIGLKDQHGIKICYFKYLPNRKWQTLVKPPGLVPNIKSNFLNVFQVPFLLLNYYTTIKKILANEKFDILHSQWAIPAGFINSFFAKKFKIPHVVSTLGAELYLSKNHPFMPFVKRVLKSCDLLFAVSDQMADRAENLGISKDKILNIPNAVDPIKFKPTELNVNSPTRTDFGLPFGPKIILSIRRFVPEKRVVDLLEAFKNSKSKDSILVLGGDGPLKDDLVSYCDENNLTDRVFFLGYVKSDTLPLLYSIASIYVLSSQQEGLSISLLESLSTGTITISTDSTGSDDAIKNNISGFLYPVGDTDKLSQLLDHSLNLEENERTLISNNARQNILNHFTTEKNVSKWVIEYQNLIKN